MGRRRFHSVVEAWDAVLVDYPLDLLALQLAHLSDVLLGDTVNQRDRVARVFRIGERAFLVMAMFYASIPSDWKRTVTSLVRRNMGARRWQ